MPNIERDARARRQAIKTLLGRDRIASQLEIARTLREMGFSVTQSSVSRDLAEMDVIKANGYYIPADFPLPERSLSVQPVGARELVLAILTAGPHQVILRTPAGAAGLVADVVDSQGWPEIVGTIAGYDTLLISTRGRAHQKRLLGRLQGLFGDRPGGC